MADDLGMEVGEMVLVNKTPDGASVVIKMMTNTTVSPTKAKKEFKEWLKTFMDENGEILDELVIR